MTQVHSLELSKGAVVVSTGLSTVPVHCAPQGLSSCTWFSRAHMAPDVFFSLFERGSPKLRMICHFGSNFLLQLGQKAVENLSFHIF